MASFDDIVNGLNNITRQLAQLNKVLAVRVNSYGSFTLGAAATTTVTDPTVSATSMVTVTPSNAAAGTLMSGTKALYVSARTAGTSFTVATADGTAAAGTETFLYSIVNP